MQYLLVIAIAGLCAGAPEILAQQVTDVPLFLHLTGLSEAGAPRIVGDGVLFSYDSPRRTRSVGVAFEHEEYGRVHAMKRNDHGLFFLWYPLDEVGDRPTEIGYRFVVDGLWIHDLRNPNREIAVNGAKISKVSLPAGSVVTVSPLLGDDGRVEFLFLPTERLQSDLMQVNGSRIFFEMPNDLQVFVAGSFNGWDPYLQRLDAWEGGYRLVTRLAPGQHFYYFVVNGIKVLDPHNGQSVIDTNGMRLSTVTIAPAPS